MKGILKGKVLHHGGPSSQPSTYEDVSIHTGEPKSTTRTSKWPEQHNMVLAELLMEQHLYGNMCNSILRKELWCDVVRTLNCRLRTNYTGPTVMMRFKNMKSDFRTLYQLSNQSGWGWDEKLHMPIASDEIWEEILMDHPKMARFRRNPFYQYKIFEKICGENIAIGTFARSSRSTQPTDEIEAEELDPGNDDFMSGNDISFINEEDFPETENGEVIKEVVEAELSNKPLSGSKRSSDISSRPSRKNKQKTKRGTIKNLLHLQNENIELFRQSIERHAPYSMTQCLTKLGNIPNLSIAALLALQDALKDNNDNKTILMTLDGEILKRWIEYVISSHPKFYAADVWQQENGCGKKI